MEATPSAADVDADAADKGSPSPAGSTTTIGALGLEFAATSSGAMILTVQPGSKAEKLGLASGDFIEGVDGHSIKDMSAAQMAAKIGDSTAKILNCIAAGDVKLR
jgi:C-terminal processing protease CtpA/Prc